MNIPLIPVIFMIIFAIGMVYGQNQFKKKNKVWGKTLTIFSALMIVCLALYANFFRSTGFEGQREIEIQYKKIQAIVLGNTLANIKHNGNNCLVIHTPMSPESNREELDSIVEGLKEGFGGSLNVTLAPVIPYSDTMMEEYKAEDFNKILRANPQCNIVISLVTFPHSEEELFKIDCFKLIESEDDPEVWIKDPEVKYPLVGIYNGYAGNTEPLFHDGLLGAMSMWKPDPDIDEKAVPENLKEAFDKRYLIVTKDNLSQVKSKYSKLFPVPKKK